MFPGLDGKKVIYLNDRHEEKDTEKENRERLYDKRILPLLDKNDLAIFGDKIDAVLWDYYRNLNLARVKETNIFYLQNYSRYPSLTKAALNDCLIIKEILKRRPDVLVPYIVSKDTHLFANKIKTRLLADYKTVETVNNKANYRRILKKLGFPIIPGLKANNLRDAITYFNYLRNQGFKKVVIKKERSAAGFGVFIIKTEKELEQRFGEHFAGEKCFILEGFIEKVKIYPNLQYWIGPREVKFVVLSDQMFNKGEVSSEGNAYPSLVVKTPHVWERIKKFSYKLCHYLQSKKYRGIIGIDFLITESGYAYSTEVNCRFNYSTFPALVIRKLFGQNVNLAWKTFTVRGCAVSFEKLLRSAKSIFITRRRKFGIFPIDIGILESRGEGQFMAVASNSQEVDDYKNKLIQVYESLH